MGGVCPEGRFDVRKKLLSVAFLSALLFSMAMPGTAMAKGDKTLVCHFDLDATEGKVVQIGGDFEDSGHYMKHDSHLNEDYEYVGVNLKGGTCPAL